MENDTIYSVKNILGLANFKISLNRGKECKKLNESSAKDSKLSWVPDKVEIEPNLTTKEAYNVQDATYHKCHSDNAYRLSEIISTMVESCLSRCVKHSDTFCMTEFKKKNNDEEFQLKTC